MEPAIALTKTDRPRFVLLAPLVLLRTFAARFCRSSELLPRIVVVVVIVFIEETILVDEMRSRLNKIFLSRRDEMKNNKETARRRLAWDDAI